MFFNLLYNNPHAQLPLPSGPAPAVGSACRDRIITSAAAVAVVRHAKPFSLLHALGGPKRGGAYRPPATRVLRRQRGCKHDGTFAFSSEAARFCGGRGRGPRRLYAAGGRQAKIRTWLDDASKKKGG